MNPVSKHIPSIAAAILASSAAHAQSTFSYFRFTPTKLRNDVSSNSIQIAEIQFLSSGSPVSTTGVIVTNPGGNTPVAETADKLIDGLNNTKWLDFHKNPVVFQFPEPITIDSYRLVTANDVNDRDPVRWTLEGSNDGLDWFTIDHRITDFETPTARGAATSDIPILGSATPARTTWAGFSSNTWDTINTNWDEGTIVPWNNDSYGTAYFNGAFPTSITVPSTVLARRLKFDAPDYTISGGTIILQGISRFDAQYPTTISSTIGGAVGLVKTGPSSIHLSGDNTFSSSVSVWEGTLRLSGAQLYSGGTTIQNNGVLELSGNKTGTGSLTVGNAQGRGTFIRSGGNATFPATPVIGSHANGAGVMIHNSGTSTLSTAAAYFTIANATGTYGSLEMNGGTITTVTDSGIRLGWAGTGSILQTGGTINCNRWFAIGGGNSTGIHTILGGTNTISANWRMILGDQGGSNATVNVGTLHGGNGTINSLRTNTSDGAITVSGNATSTAFLNLNSGTVNLSSRIYRNAGTGHLHWNGATLRAATNQVELLNNSFTSALVFHNGAVVDTTDKDATISTNLTPGAGLGFYPADGIVTIPLGGSGYLGSPLVTITSSGSGTRTQAIARIENGSVTQVEITSPGINHQPGDILTFTFTSGNPTLPASNYEYMITAADLKEHSAGGLKKSGTGKLTLSGSPTYTGTTEITAGTLAVTGTLAQSPIQVAAAGTLTGPLNSQANVDIAGTLAPGTNVGTTTTTQQVTFLPGSSLKLQIADWTGTAGTAHDLLQAGSVHLNTTTASPLTIQVDTTGLLNFSESPRSFTIASTGTPVTGLDANVQVTTTDFSGHGSWEVSTSGNDLILTYTPSTSGFGSWIDGFEGISDTSANGDDDKDGVSNLLEYVLNRHPGQAEGSASLTLPVLDGSDYVFTFVRRAESKNDTVQSFAISTNLTDWTPTTIPATTTGNVTVTPDQPSAGLETISIRVPATTATQGKLFGRLEVSAP